MAYFALAGLIAYLVFYSSRKFPLPFLAVSSWEEREVAQFHLAVRTAGIWVSLMAFSNFGFYYLEAHFSSHFFVASMLVAAVFVPKIIADHLVWKVGVQWAVHLAQHISWIAFLLLFIALPDMVGIPLEKTLWKVIFTVAAIGVWLLIYRRLFHRPWIWTE